MKIGIDIGEVILTKARKNSKPKEIAYAVESIEKLAKKYEIFLISKTEKETNKQKTINDLKNIDFFNKTGIKEENLFFVTTYNEKVNKAKELEIDVFIDDDYRVLEKMMKVGIKHRICLDVSNNYKKGNEKQGKLFRNWIDILKEIEKI
ncbi:MAG: hypothetical protein N2Z20_00140 [Elusimicrobiales bacterium]|nr:hypothetical protein [Elusimicrobiales bacterium]